jgi:hypothetical protein
MTIDWHYALLMICSAVRLNTFTNMAVSSATPSNRPPRGVPTERGEPREVGSHCWTQVVCLTQQTTKDDVTVKAQRKRDQLGPNPGPKVSHVIDGAPTEPPLNFNSPRDILRGVFQYPSRAVASSGGGHTEESTAIAV